ncbi:MAG: hypothetical protein COA73_15970 [Candidatus Hydrogenedentota bacterium]|nr:MAG: hypothetical protein COA73_17025 [Candidatus Hydrogenedentota bacterium]PCJ52829.1 MAG: hypothetical protein COA73_15970 [Candidatus Hydrogenedentota bacterium]
MISTWFSRRRFRGLDAKFEQFYVEHRRSAYDFVLFMGETGLLKKSLTDRCLFDQMGLEGGGYADS